ncbi:MAG: hypothetical protein V1899_01790, partial [Planctomycetota bacterium]
MELEKRPVTSKRNGLQKVQFVMFERFSTHFREGWPMGNTIMVGCDLHDKTMLLKIAVGQGASQRRSFENNVDA